MEPQHKSDLHLLHHLSEGTGWDGMGWDGMGWDGMGRDGTGWQSKARQGKASQGKQEDWRKSDLIVIRSHQKILILSPVSASPARVSLLTVWPHTFLLAVSHWLLEMLSRAVSDLVEKGWARSRTPWQGWQKFTTRPFSLGSFCPNQNWKGLSCLLSRDDSCVAVTCPSCWTALHGTLLVLFAILANICVYVSYRCRTNPYKLDLAS